MFFLKEEEIVMAKENNIKDVALIFEGGGMRGAFSAGIGNVLLEENLFFDYVAGISAGSTMVVNYTTRDKVRMKKSFVDLVDDPDFGGWKSFVRGRGYFNAEYIYENTSGEGETLPLKFEDFMENKAKLRIIAFDVKKGQPKVFTRRDIKSIKDLMKIVRASSSLPIFMPPTEFKGRTYVDGGLSGGIPINVAIKDGYEKFFIVRTREKHYRKEPVKHRRFLKRYFKNSPEIFKALVRRPYEYNKQCDLMENLEKEGRAYIVYPENMFVSNRETRKDKLEKLYEDGYNQGRREKDRWKEFLFSE